MLTGRYQSISSWSQSLEDLVHRSGVSSRAHRATAFPFAPKRVVNPRVYDSVPALMVVATAASKSLHRALFEAIEIMEKASGAFKVVLFTESESNESYRDLDWVVEHCFNEMAWSVLSNENWLDMASRRLSWAVEAYGVSFVLAADELDGALAELDRLGEFFGLNSEMVRASRDHFATSSDTQPDKPHHASLRGWVERLGPDHSCHTVELAESTKIQVHFHAGSTGHFSLVFASGVSGAVVEQAQAWGATTVVLEAEQVTNDDLVQQMHRAVSDGVARKGGTVFLVDTKGHLGAGHTTVGLVRVMDSSDCSVTLPGSEPREYATLEFEEALGIVQAFSTAHTLTKTIAGA